MYLGEVKLMKTMFMIDTVEELCLKCCNNDYTHYQSFEQCLINEHLIQYQPKYVSDGTIFSITSSLIFLIDSKEFQIFQRKEMKWFCNSCLTKCNRSGYMKNILPHKQWRRALWARWVLATPQIINFPLD